MGKGPESTVEIDPAKAERLAQIHERLNGVLGGNLPQDAAAILQRYNDAVEQFGSEIGQHLSGEDEAFLQALVLEQTGELSKEEKENQLFGATSEKQLAKIRENFRSSLGVSEEMVPNEMTAHEILKKYRELVAHDDKGNAQHLAPAEERVLERLAEKE